MLNKTTHAEAGDRRCCIATSLLKLKGVLQRTNRLPLKNLLDRKEILEIVLSALQNN